MTYRPANFSIAELVDPWFIANHTEAEIWAMLDEQALRALQALRDRFGRLVVNGPLNGRIFKESGLRRSDTATGAPRSQHKSGRAFDVKPRDTSVKVIYDWILANQSEAYSLGIRRVEDIRDTPTWLHFDTKDTGPLWVGKIQVVRP